MKIKKFSVYFPQYSAEMTRKGIFAYIYACVVGFFVSLKCIRLFSFKPDIVSIAKGVNYKPFHILVIPWMKLERYRQDAEKGIDEVCDME